MKLCADGNYVGRDPNNGCNFYPCDGIGDCEDHSLLCTDGSYVSRDPNNGCDFIPCPGEPWKCDKGLMECEDGVYVSDQDAECEYVPCAGTTGPDRHRRREDENCPTEEKRKLCKLLCRRNQSTRNERNIRKCLFNVTTIHSNIAIIM